MTLERLKLKLHPHTTCGHRLQSYEAAVLDFLFLHYFPSQLLSSPFLSCPPIRIGVTQVRGHKVGSSPPSPLRYVPCIFIARRIRHLLPPLVDSLASNCACAQIFVRMYDTPTHRRSAMKVASASSILLCRTLQEEQQRVGTSWASQTADEAS